MTFAGPAVMLAPPHWASAARFLFLLGLGGHVWQQPSQHDVPQSVLEDLSVPMALTALVIFTDVRRGQSSIPSPGPACCQKPAGSALTNMIACGPLTAGRYPLKTCHLWRLHVLVIVARLFHGCASGSADRVREHLPHHFPLSMLCPSL